jgi:hypothetical protein
MIYSEVDESTSSGNVSQQVTGVYSELDESVYTDVGHAVARVTHINNTVVRSCLN